jgi:lipopolysaccharide export system protein LptA
VDFPAVDLDATIPTADAPVVHNAGTDAWEQAESDAAQGKLRVDKLEEQLDVAIKATALADQNVADLEEQLESAVAAAAQLTDSAAAEALRADYDIDSGTIVMTGDVLLTQGPSALTAQKMTVDLKNGSAHMSGRVKTILQTGSN